MAGNRWIHCPLLFRSGARTEPLFLIKDMAYKIVNFKLYDINVSVIYIVGYKTRILVGKNLDNVKPIDSDNTSFLLNYFLNSGVFTKVS
jgi:hypothetical protein